MRTSSTDILVACSIGARNAIYNLPSIARSLRFSRWRRMHGAMISPINVR
jgi:hypothetical protein